MRAPASPARGFSLVELLIVVAIIGVLAALALPNFFESKQAAYNASAVASLRLIHAAETSYRSTHDQFGDFNALSTSGSLTDPLLVTGHRGNYTFKVTSASANNYEVTATPVREPWRYYYVDGSGVIRSNLGGPADVSSQPIDY